MDQSLGLQLEKDEAVAKAMKKADALLLDNGMDPVSYTHLTDSRYHVRGTPPAARW